MIAVDRDALISAIRKTTWSQPIKWAVINMIREAVEYDMDGIAKHFYDAGVHDEYNGVNNFGKAMEDWKRDE